MKINTYFLLIIDLTIDMTARIQMAYKLHDIEEIQKGFKLVITRKDLFTLNNQNWLNDNIINFYLNLIVKRCHEEVGLPICSVVNSFFYTSLQMRGFQQIKRWTKKQDIFKKDILFIPVNHKNIHWALFVGLIFTY